MSQEKIKIALIGDTPLRQAAKSMLRLFASYDKSQNLILGTKFSQEGWKSFSFKDFPIEFVEISLDTNPLPECHGVLWVRNNAELPKAPRGNEVEVVSDRNNPYCQLAKKIDKTPMGIHTQQLSFSLEKEEEESEVIPNDSSVNDTVTPVPGELKKTFDAIEYILNNLVLDICIAAKIPVHDLNKLKNLANNETILKNVETIISLVETKPFNNNNTQSPEQATDIEIKTTDQNSVNSSASKSSRDFLEFMLFIAGGIILTGIAFAVVFPHLAALAFSLIIIGAFLAIVVRPSINIKNNTPSNEIDGETNPRQEVSEIDEGTLLSSDQAHSFNNPILPPNRVNEVNTTIVYQPKEPTNTTNNRF